MLQNLKSLLMWSLALTLHAGIEVSVCLGKLCINRDRHLPIERVMHTPQHSHIRPGYRYSSLSLQSLSDTSVQLLSRQSSFPQGCDIHFCAAMCITDMVSKQNTTCKNGIRVYSLTTSLGIEGIAADQLRVTSHPCSPPRRVSSLPYSSLWYLSH
jgi:hypothetical protein